MLESICIEVFNIYSVNQIYLITAIFSILELAIRQAFVFDHLDTVSLNRNHRISNSFFTTNWRGIVSLFYSPQHVFQIIICLDFKFTIFINYLTVFSCVIINRLLFYILVLIQNIFNQSYFLSIGY